MEMLAITDQRGHMATTPVTLDSHLTKTESQPCIMEMEGTMDHKLHMEVVDKVNHLDHTEVLGTLDQPLVPDSVMLDTHLHHHLVLQAITLLQEELFTMIIITKTVMENMERRSITITMDIITDTITSTIKFLRNANMKITYHLISWLFHFESPAKTIKSCSLV